MILTNTIFINFTTNIYSTLIQPKNDDGSNLWSSWIGMNRKKHATLHNLIVHCAERKRSYWPDGLDQLQS